MREMDQGIKRIVQTHPRDVLELALPGAEYLGPAPVDVAAEPQLVLDTLQRVRYHGVECLVDIEAEATPRPDIGRRCFEYGSRASVVHQLPVVSVVLWLERGGRPPSSPYVMRVAELPPATWPFHGIRLYALPAERVLTGDLAELVGLLPLVPFMRGGAGSATIERAAHQIQERIADAEQQTIAETLLVLFATRHVGPNDALALFRRLFMSTEILEQSPLYREWIAEALQRGEALGRAAGEAAGRAEGRAEGETDGLRQATHTALLGRWQSLPAEIETALTGASSATLNDILAHLTTDTLEQVRGRLGL